MRLVQIINESLFIFMFLLRFISFIRELNLHGKHNFWMLIIRLYNSNKCKKFRAKDLRIVYNTQFFLDKIYKDIDKLYENKITYLLNLK